MLSIHVTHLVSRCYKYGIYFNSVQLLSHVWLFVTPWIAACQASLFITNIWSLHKLMSIKSVMPSSHLILCHPLPFLPPIPPSIRRDFCSESTFPTTGKIIALTRHTFVDKVMSLLFNMLSMLVITFLPRSKCLLISWLQSPSAVILKPPPPKKNKVWHCFHYFPTYFPTYFPWSDGTRCHDLSFMNAEL